MLLPHQVIPFLQHEEVDVREHALRYLAAAHDPAPATAENVWELYDRSEGDLAVNCAVMLAKLPQTESSTRRLIDAIRNPQPELVDFHLQHAAMEIDLPLLLAHREELLGCERLVPRVRDHLQARLDLLAEPAETIWERLSDFSRTIEDAYYGEFDMAIPQQLIEAMVRHGPPLVDRAVSTFETEEGSWLEIFLADFLGRIRHEPAVPMLLEKMRDEGDILPDRIVDALVSVGTAEVVRQVEAFYPRQSWDVRLYLGTPLERIKRPESEGALLRLLEVEEDEGLKGHLAACLCRLCTTEGLDRVREIWLADEYDPQMDDLDELLLTSSRMAGYDFAEADELRRTVSRRRAAQRASLRSLSRSGERYRQRWREGYIGNALSLDRERDAPPLLDVAPEPAFDRDVVPEPAFDRDVVPAAPATIRRDAPKVGRNDPCPCGSGRKHKKCCGK